jgi:hypothetical protein
VDAKKDFAGKCGLSANTASASECKDLNGLKIRLCDKDLWKWFGRCKNVVQFQNEGAIQDNTAVSACKGGNKQSCADALGGVMGNMMGVDLKAGDFLQ